MGAQDNVHAALTIASSIDKHTGTLKKCASSISSQTGHVKKMAGGTNSGDLAVRLLDNSAQTVKHSASVLEDVSARLRGYASRIQNS